MKAFDQFDEHVILVCSPLDTSATSQDITTWDYISGDSQTEVVVIPARYYDDIVRELSVLATKLDNVYWNMCEEDWVEGEDVKEFASICKVAAEKAKWPTESHRELVFAAAGLAERAVKRGSPIILFT